MRCGDNGESPRRSLPILGPEFGDTAGMSDRDDSTESPEAAPATEPLEDAPVAAWPTGQRSPRRRAPALIVAALLVGAGLFLALRGMQQVVARAPAAPVPTTIPSPAPAAPAETPMPTLQPTPMPTSSPLILLP